MGTQNRVTEEKYKQIKAFVTEQELKGKMMSQIDAAVEKKFGFKQSTSQNIRRTKDYQGYCERVFRFHGNPVKKPATMKKSSKKAENINPQIFVLASAPEANTDRSGRLLAFIIGIILAVLSAVVVALLWRAYVN